MTNPAEPQIKSGNLQKGLYLLGALGQGVTFIAVQPFAIRILDGHQWGTVSLTMSIIAIALVAITAGLPMTIGAAYFAERDGISNARKINGFGIALSLMLALVATIIYAGGSGLSNNPLDWVVILAIVCIALHGVSQMALSFLRSEQRAVWFVIVLLTATSVGHLFGLYCIATFRPTAFTYVAAFTSCVLIASLLGIFLTRPSRFSIRSTLIHGSVKTALPVLPHAIGLIALQQGEAILIAVLAGTVAVGRYNSVMPFALGAIAVVLALGNVWQTVILSLQGDGNRIENKQTQIEAYLFATAIAIGGTFSAAALTPILVDSPSPSLLQLAKVLPVIAVGYTAFLIASAQLFAINKTKSFAVVTPIIAACALLAMCSPAYAQDFLILGLIKVVSYLLLGVIFCWIAYRLNKQLIHFKPLFISIAASAIATTVALLCPTNPAVNLVSMAVGMLIAIALIAYSLIHKRQSARGI